MFPLSRFVGASIGVTLVFDNPSKWKMIITYM
ncbi:hypothetical protein EDB38_10487 [Vibrio crassostreae]|nr:hypothetical protein EDB30_11188 [Vibrio crassostreae]TCT52591.1 hypothetical protein EDB42_10487 [Vibrio crassostreae]TCT77656.1 hypothetical protein EDB41_10487 [Vibrio crassostreae]TCT96308.1 hypothetical protein EDB38_10487 [Vibrio crassostreae]